MNWEETRRERYVCVPRLADDGKIIWVGMSTAVALGRALPAAQAEHSLSAE